MLNESHLCEGCQGQILKTASSFNLYLFGRKNLKGQKEYKNGECYHNQWEVVENDLKPGKSLILVLLLPVRVAKGHLSEPPFSYV